MTKGLGTAQRCISQTHQALPSMGFSRQEYWSGVPLPSPYLIYSITQLLFLWLCRRKITMYKNLFTCNLFTFKQYYPAHLFFFNCNSLPDVIFSFFVYLKNVFIHRISVHIFINLKRHKIFARCKSRQTSSSMNMLFLFAVGRITVVLLKCIPFWETAKLGLFFDGFQIHDALSETCSRSQKH